ncbi:MAG: N-6 DNA methylase [Cyanobacteria bacterium P01_D01_bin.56]
MTVYDTLKKNYVKILKQLSPHRHKWDIFSDWLEIAAISMHQLPYQSGELERDTAFETYEAKYMEAIKRYSREELSEMAKLLGITIQAYNTGFRDFLGELAGDEGLLNEAGGQFFTPYSVCRMMAKMTVGNVDAQLKEHGTPLLVSEPAVGGGAMVIACAEEIMSQKIDPRAYVQFDAVDISRTAFNMAYIGLSALGLQAMVRHGNTLSMEMWEHRPTPQLRLFDKWLQERRQTQRLETMRDLIVNPGSVINDNQADSTPPPAAEDVPEPLETAENLADGTQISLFDENTFMPADTDNAAAKRRNIVQLPPPEHRQLGLFNSQKQPE